MGIKIQTNLPEDIEAKIAAVHESISLLERTDSDLKTSIAQKQAEEIELNNKIVDATNTLNEVLEKAKEITVSLDEREIRINQKESALNTYANALTEKENKINKYLAVFDNMKKIST